MRITVLVNDEAAAPLIAEHGLALWIETGGRRILFDTGQGRSLVPNAQGLKIDLGATETVILSHGHYDHGGGLAELLRAGAKPDVYVHPTAALAKYEVEGGCARSIGLPAEAASALAGMPASRRHWISGPVDLTSGIGLTGTIPRGTGYENSGGPFFLDPGGLKPDPFEDDMALWIATTGGLVVCVGCAHAGIVNTIRHALGVSGESRLRAVIGGFHLLEAGEGRIEKTAQALRELEPDLVAPCHCTGVPASARLREALGGRFDAVQAGSILTF